MKLTILRLHLPLGVWISEPLITCIKITGFQDQAKVKCSKLEAVRVVVEAV